MFAGKLVFSQLMDHLPWKTFGRIVGRYGGDHRVREFNCAHQFRCMAFAQLAYRDSLRDTVICLRAQSAKLYHLGLRASVAKSTLADANELRDWRIYAEFAQHLMRHARTLYAGDSLDVDLQSTVYALDSTTIDLCLSLFAWAPFRSTKAAIKLHTLIDLRGNIPSFIHISDGKLHDVNILDQLLIEPGAFYVMDRGYVDFERLHKLHRAGAFFVTRAKSNMNALRRYSRKVDRSTGLICDQDIILNVYHSKSSYPDALRRIRYRTSEGKTLVFLSNNFDLPALTIAQLYRCRWQVELFFKWIKQHLHIKSFFGISENAVKTQVWIAISTYVLVAIVRKRLQLQASLYEILQILSLNLFETTPLNQLLTMTNPHDMQVDNANQLNLFEF